MNEWFKKTTETIKSKWGKWTGLQKAIAGGIILAVIVAIVLMLLVKHGDSKPIPKKNKLEQYGDLVDND